jgi:hypothetical protein
MASGQFAFFPAPQPAETAQVHAGPGFVPLDPVGSDRLREAGAELVRRAAFLEETTVDQFDVNPAVLGRLGGVGDFHELARGYGGVTRLDEFHGPR